MHNFIHNIVNSRALYAFLIVLNAPGWAAYSMHLRLLPAIEHSVFYIVAGVTILTLDALVVLAYALHLIFAFVEYLMDR